MRVFYLALMFLLLSMTLSAQCPAVSDFSESFDAADEMPECWSTLRVNPPSSPFAVVQVQTNAANSYSPNNSIRMFNQLGGDAEFYLISPKVNNLGDGTHQLRFVYRGQPNGDGLDAVIEVGTMTDVEDGDSFTLVETLTNTSAEFTEYTITFDQSSTDEYVAIKADFEVTFRNLYFDDVVWEAIPTCPKPTDLVAQNLTSSSADLSWTPGGSESEWEVVYGLAGFDPETEGTTVMDTDALGETIENLTIGTDYEFYVKAICDVDDQSVWSFAGAFTTLCDVYPLDYLQDFSTFIPNCWNEADGGNPTTGPTDLGSSNWTDVNYLNDEANGQAVKIILFSTSVSDWLISPEIDLSTGVGLSYNVGITTLNGTTPPTALGADDQIQVLITTDAGTTWEALATYNNDNIPPATGITEVIDLSAYSGTAQFAFWATDGAVADGSGTYDVFFDNFAITAVELPCVEVTDLAVDNITSTSTTVTWTENGVADTWELLYGLEGFDPETEGVSVMANTTPSLDLPDLTADSFYDVYVRALCSETDSSAWVGPVTFTTLVSGIEDLMIEGLGFYPNPVKAQLTINANTKIDNVTIYSIVGGMIYQSTIGNTKGQIDVSNLTPGLYLMTVKSNNIYQTVKFVKQ